MLTSFGATQIEEAEDGKKAIHLMTKRPFDVIICDYYLGEGKNGQQVLEEARHHKLIKDATVFFMVTAETGHDWVLGAVEYKPDAYLAKPFTKEILKLRLDKVMEKKGALLSIYKSMEKQRYDRAIALCDQFIRESPAEAFEYLKLKGEILLAKGDYEDAKVLFEGILEMRDLPWAAMGLGEVCYRLGDLQKAQEIFEDLIEQHNMHMDAYDWLAKVKDQQGDGKGAQQILMDATKQSPKAMQRQRTLGQIALKNKDFETATRSFRAAVRLGKHSCLKSSKEYAGLARAMAANGSGLAALKHQLRAPASKRTAPPMPGPWSLAQMPIAALPKCFESRRAVRTGVS